MRPAFPLEKRPYSGYLVKKVKDHETHLPAQPLDPQAPSWLPRPYGHQNRSRAYCASPRQGPQAPFRLSFVCAVTAPATLKKKKKPNRLTVRRDFLAVAGTEVRFVAPAFILQKGKVKDAGAVRYGLTATKKLGGAVVRNRARRRLRALAQKILLTRAVPDDYVLIARAGALTLAFAQMEQDLLKALKVLRCLKD